MGDSMRTRERGRGRRERERGRDLVLALEDIFDVFLIVSGRVRRPLPLILLPLARVLVPLLAVAAVSLFAGYDPSYCARHRWSWCLFARTHAHMNAFRPPPPPRKKKKPAQPQKKTDLLKHTLFRLLILELALGGGFGPMVAGNHTCVPTPGDSSAH